MKINVERLLMSYKRKTPRVEPLWCCSPTEKNYMDVSEDILECGVAIYKSPLQNLWDALQDPIVYERETLWRSIHDSEKIARIIIQWEMKIKLSPPFLQFNKYGKLLVLDGKHRLTVARYMAPDDIFFAVGAGDEENISKVIPAAVKMS